MTVFVGSGLAHGTSPETFSWTVAILCAVFACLMQVSANLSHRYTAEFYAVKHFSHLVPPGSKMQGYVPREQTQGMPVIVFQRPDKRYVVIIGNQSDEQRTVTVKLGKKFLNMTILAHSMHSYITK